MHRDSDEVVISWDVFKSMRELAYNICYTQATTWDAILSLISYGIGYSSQMKVIYDRIFIDRGARSEAIRFTYAQAHQQILRSATCGTIYHQMDDVDHFMNQLTVLDEEFNHKWYSQGCYLEETNLVLYDPTEALRKFSHLFFSSYLFVLWQSLRSSQVKISHLHKWGVLEFHQGFLVFT